MSDARIGRRLLRKMLERARCTACSGPLDEHAHRALWIDDRGDAHKHLVCERCLRSAAGNQEKIDELATKCALALCEPGGRA